MILFVLNSFMSFFILYDTVAMTMMYDIMLTPNPRF